MYMRLHDACWISYCFVMCLLMGGCAGFGVAGSEPESGRLMPLWKTYVHCRDSRDLDEMLADSDWLRRQAFNFEPSVPVSLLPKAAWSALLKLPSRLAVDPDALAADCSLRAGLEAQARSKPVLAAAIFRMIAQTYPVDRYAYYVERARSNLDERDSIASLPDHASGTIVLRSPDEHVEDRSGLLSTGLLPTHQAIGRW